jgi:hypothetical protein
MNQEIYHTETDSTVLLSSYEYLGDFSAAPPWLSRSMSCDDCRVSWTGCWDNFQCPKCGMGDLPGFGGEPITLAELKSMHEECLKEFSVEADFVVTFTTKKK